MTDTTGLEWLTVGATVALVVVHSHSETVKEATVEKIGKRDVVVTVNGRTEKFNIGHTMAYLGSADIRWLVRRNPGSWGGSTQLGPLDHPRVKAIRDREERDNATSDVRRYADEFHSRRDVDTARKLRAAVDNYLKLHEETE